MTQYTDLEIPPTPVTPPTAPPSQKKGCVKYGAIGCASLIVLCGLFVAVVVLLVTTMFHSSEPYQESLRRTNNDLRVTSKLGAPVKGGWFMQGQINTTAGGTGNADMSYSLKGSKARGSMHVVGTKTGGVWKYSEMRVRTEDGASIDLLTTEAIEQEY